MMDLTPYVVLDTETDGLPPGQMPWEIALISRSRDVAVWVEEVIHVTDYDVSLMSPEADAINGFSRRWTKERGALHMTTENAVAYLEQRLRGRRIVGSNPAFDTDALLHLGCKPVWDYVQRDIPSMFLGAYGYEVRGLAGVCEALGILNAAPHTALGDAQATRDAFEHILLDVR